MLHTVLYLGCCLWASPEVNLDPAGGVIRYHIFTAAAVVASLVSATCVNTGAPHPAPCNFVAYDALLGVSHVGVASVTAALVVVLFWVLGI
jgi:hypothetical protein